MSGSLSPSLQSVDTDFDANLNAIGLGTAASERSAALEETLKGIANSSDQTTHDRERALAEREQSVREREVSVRERELAVSQREAIVTRREECQDTRECLDRRHDEGGVQVEQIPVRDHESKPHPPAIPSSESIDPEGLPDLSEAAWADISSLLKEGTHESHEKALSIILPLSLPSKSPLLFRSFVDNSALFAKSIPDILCSDTTLRHFLRALIRQVALNPAYTPAAIVLIQRIRRHIVEHCSPIGGGLVHPLSTILNQDFRDLQIGWARVENMYSVLAYPRFKQALRHATEMASSFRTIIGTRDELTQRLYLQRTSNVKDLMNELCDLGITRV
ncbi:unnamed protein product [Peniophora sp. CBMAI 1063]|nr:unnamed protein product [Peniophora sp. CBMAI 1063]